MRFVKDEEYLKYCGLKLVSALGKEGKWLDAGFRQMFTEED